MSQDQFNELMEFPFMNLQEIENKMDWDEYRTLYATIRPELTNAQINKTPRYEVKWYVNAWIHDYCNNSGETRDDAIAFLWDCHVEDQGHGIDIN